MRLSITRVQRSTLLFLSACGYTAWFSGLDQPLEAQGLEGSPMPVFTLRPEAALPRVGAVVVRDPFAGPVATSLPVSASFPAAPPLAAAGQNDADGMTVPDIGTSGAAPVGGPGLIVRATIAGPNPVAYVANGTAMDVVRVGDTLGDRQIIAIDLRGVAFHDGSRLDLPLAPAAAPRTVQPRTVTLGIDEIRHLLLPGGSAGPSPSPSPPAVAPSPAAAPSASSPPNDPTPAPLRTVDARGIPAGGNPTPDSVDATPFPDPYPYAPAPRRSQ
jgi:hypothetical protein